MKNISTIISIIALLLVGVLYFLFFSRGTKPTEQKTVTEAAGPVQSHFRVAYFDIDTLEANYDYFKDVLSQVKSRENAMNMELGGMEKNYQKKITEWQKKMNNMSPAENEQVQREYATMQQTYQSRKQALQEELFRQNEDLKSDIKKRIEAFLKEYNKGRQYSFIFAYESNSFMYYEDTTYNITRDLVAGLNSEYSKKKK